MNIPIFYLCSGFRLHHSASFLVDHINTISFARSRSAPCEALIHSQMASTLCCIAGHRSRSSEGLNAHPLFVSSARDANVPRSIKLARPEELELNRIFVAASLPEDHPDALYMPGRKPPFDPSMVRSPSFGNKLRRRISRHTLVPSKSMSSLMHSGPRLLHRKSRVHKDDLSIEEIFGDKAAAEGGYDSDAHSVQIMPRIASDKTSQGKMTCPPLRPVQSMVLPSFEWLAPCIKE